MIYEDRVAVVGRTTRHVQRGSERFAGQAPSAVGDDGAGAGQDAFGEVGDQVLRGRSRRRAVSCLAHEGISHFQWLDRSQLEMS